MKSNNYIFKEDERIIGESGKYCYYTVVAMIFLAICSIVIKVSFEVPFVGYSLEIISLVIGAVIYLVDEKRKGILFVEKSDECLLEMHYKTFRYILIAMLFTFALGDVVLSLITDGVLYYASNIIIWIIPLSIFTVIAVKKGWLTFEKKNTAEKRNESELTRVKALALRCFGGSIIFGSVMFLSSLKEGKSMNIDNVIIVIKMAIMWGVLFFAAMYTLIRISERNSDKKVKEADVEDEE
ncbi:MAG: hypothetical protein E7254_05270 [Lachnospiraceae bacterium]|nr:hypothetical protein [Lachnospiraceae bacterium]